MTDEQQWLRIGILWRGDRQAVEPLPCADRGLGALYAAFAQLPVVIEQVPYSDDLVDEVRDQLLTLDGVLVWVNPIQDGQDRKLLDDLLREVSATGVWVSAHPDVVLQMGTKEIAGEIQHRHIHMHDLIARTVGHDPAPDVPGAALLPTAAGVRSASATRTSACNECPRLPDEVVHWPMQPCDCFNDAMVTSYLSCDMRACPARAFRH